MIERLKAALAERYDIERKLGEGGMATVYLASDPKHGRKVAVKVLRPELAAVVGAERFLTEIETTAGLQHPHILPLFDSGQADGFLFYVMPYVEGESLRERLDREKQLPVDEAVRIAQETAQALDYAHRHGVVHRDVKPANILLHEGRPLVVDFGIALAVQQAGAGRLTETGMSLGTPYYMSPEQATGDRDVDARSDVYSLACVLYEMLTGEPPYTGSTAQVVLGRIITGDVPRPSLLRRSVPPHVEDAILHALKKVPADRPGSAAAFAAELAGEGVPAARPRGRSPRASGVGTRVEAVPPLARLALGALGAALVALVAWQAGRRAGAGDADPVVRAVLELPSNAFLETAKIALSPDGRTVVVAARRDGARVLLRRPLDALRFEPIAGTVEAENPSISPDGRWLAFNGPAGLVRVPVEGGGTVSIDSEMEWGGSAWTADGALVYSRDYNTGLWRAPASGGTPESLTAPDTTAGELGHWWPQVLPDGEHVLFTVMKTPVERATVSVLSLQSRERTEILEGGVSGRYVPTGHLLYAANEILFAVPYDPGRLEVTGPAVPVVEGVAMDHPNAAAAFDVSRDGTLVYVPAEDYSSPVQPVWVDREGRETPILPDEGRYQGVDVSPDGERLAVTMSEAGRAPDVWVVDLRRGTRTQLTSGGGVDGYPLWTPDGEQIVFESETPIFDLFVRPADARRPAEPLVRSREDKYPSSFTPDGDTLLYGSLGLSDNTFRRVSLRDGGAGGPIAVEGTRPLSPALSPDGRWLAYASAESGRYDIYLVPYQDPSRSRAVVSTNGGAYPLWTKGGREIVFRDGDAVLAVPVDPGSGSLGRPDTLFRGPYSWAGFGEKAFDVTPDGERFAMLKVRPDRLPRRVVVVTGFFEELRALAGGGPR